MTPPVTTGALAAASDLIRESLRIGAPGLTVDTQRALLRSIMLKLTGKVLRPLMAERDAALAALQQVTAERDEARDLAYELKLAAAGGEDVPGSANLVTVEDVRRWRDEDARFVSTATSELARLRAEGEAKDRALLLLLPFVDYAAGEGLMFVETEDGEHPEMDAADIVIAAAKEIGLELGSDASEAFLAAGYDAIRAARAATAREG